MQFLMRQRIQAKEGKITANNQPRIQSKEGKITTNS